MNKEKHQNNEINRKKSGKGMLLRVEPERPVNPYSPVHTKKKKERATQTLRNSAKTVKMDARC